MATVPRTRLDLAMLLGGIVVAAAPWLLVWITDASWWPEDLQRDLQNIGQRADIALAAVFFLGCGLALAAVVRLVRRWATR